MLVTQTDIELYADLNSNIEAAKIYPHIRSAEKDVFRPQIGDTFYNALKSLEDLTITKWVTITVYNIGDYVYDELSEFKVYKSLTTNGATRPHTSVTDWELQELGSFWYEHIKKWLVFETMYKYLTFAGRNASDWGVVVHQQDNHRQIIPKERAEMAGTYRRQIAGSSNGFWQKICDVSNTFDNIKYEFTNVATIRKSGGIRAIE